METEPEFRPPAGEVVSNRCLPPARSCPSPSPGATTRWSGNFLRLSPPGSADLSLSREYAHYLGLPALGLGNGGGLAPRLLGRWPGRSLGLSWKPCPARTWITSCSRPASTATRRPSSGVWKNWPTCWPFFTPGRSRRCPVSPEPALAYLDKVMAQLLEAGLLTREDWQALARERQAWEGAARIFPTGRCSFTAMPPPPIFSSPTAGPWPWTWSGWAGDRLWDLSWVAGELKHAWGWRTADFSGSEAAIRHFFQAYLTATNLDPALTRRVYGLNPFYMALAELRIARNLYLTRDYRRELVAEARRCLAHGRRL